MGLTLDRHCRKKIHQLEQQNEAQKEEKLEKKNKESISDLWSNIKQSKARITIVPNRLGGRNRKYLKK